jgi:hypothetical protein
MDQIDPNAAREALADVEGRRRQVAGEIGVPAAYWWGVALGWVALGVIADAGNAVLTTVAMFVFGAVHASVAPRVLDGRHGSRDLSVRREVAGHRIAGILLGCLVLLGGLTVALSLAATADGADHPTTIASVVVALAILGGGPQLVGVLRRRAVRGEGR